MRSIERGKETRAGVASESSRVEGTIAIAEPRTTAADRVGHVYVRFRDSVFRTAMRHTAGDRASAEDITHDVFVRLLGSIDDLDDDELLGGWLYRVTVNFCLTRLRRERFRRSVRLLLGVDDRAPSTPERDASARDELAKVLSTIASLPPKERVVFTMLHLDGRSQSEIAQVLGHSKGYVSKLVERGRAHVRAAGWEVGDV